MKLDERAREIVGMLDYFRSCFVAQFKVIRRLMVEMSRTEGQPLDEIEC